MYIITFVNNFIFNELFVLLSQQNNVQPMKQAQNPDANTNKGTEQKNNHIKKSSSPIGIKEEKQGDGPNTKEDNTDEVKKPVLGWGRKFFEPAALWQFITVIITSITLIWIIQSTNHQFSISEKALTKSDSANRQSLELTRKAVSVAEQSLILADSSFMETKKSNKISQNLIRDNLRAYVVISGFTNNIYKAGKIFTIKVNIINKGLTPAKNIEVFTDNSICLSNKNIGKKFKDIVEALKSTTKKNVMLGPNVPDKRQIYETLVTKKDSVNWANNICDLILLVGIQYHDIFGVVHHTIGCYNYDIITGEYYVNTFGNYNLVD